MKKILNISLLTLLPLLAVANEGGDFFDNIGKIYVVVGVLLILFVAIIAFMIVLERRIAKLEEEEGL